MEKIGGSISYQLIDIFNIIDDTNLDEEEKRTKIIEYQKSLTQEKTGILIDSERKDGQCKKNGYFVFGDIDLLSYEYLEETKKYVDNYLSSFTCEVEMKMSALLAGYDKANKKIIFEFDKAEDKNERGMADKVYEYAMSKGKAMRGHTLVWHKHEPKALDDYIQVNYNGNIEEDKANNPELFESKRKELTKSFLEEYIKSVGEKYPKCYCWDVLNEIIPQFEIHNIEDEKCPKQNEREEGLRDSIWREYLGRDFYIEVLKIARKNLPKGTKMFYNDFGEQYPQKRKAIIELIKKIKIYERDHREDLVGNGGKVETLLDGWGLQSHYDINMSLDDIDEIYNDISELQKWLKDNDCSELEIQVTEMDVAPGKDKEGNNLTYDSNNMPKYEAIWNKVFECCGKVGVKAFSGWGISDPLNWFGDIGATMVAKNGVIKDFAKNLFTNREQEKATGQEIGKKTMQSFCGNTEKAMKTMENLEYKVKSKEQAKEDNTK